MRRKIIIAVTLTLLVGLIFFLADRTGEKIKSGRMVAMNMLSCMSVDDDKSKITTSDLSDQCKMMIDQIEHPSDATIIAYNRKWHITIAFNRVKTNNQSTWKCKGSPLKLFPLECR